MRLPPQNWDLLIVGARIATFMPTETAAYGHIAADAVAIAGERIAWIGNAAQLPKEAAAVQRLDAAGMWLTPGLVDCHTHLVHAGSRAREFKMRLQGASYQDIAQAGGGIRATVTATRAANLETLVAQSRPRLQALVDEGVTTVEIKSGYGLDLETELNMLRAARQLEQLLPVSVRTTFLGAHALPVEYEGRADDYIDFLCHTVLPAAAQAGLVDAVDAFCERIGFTVEQTTRILQAAQALGLPVKLHAEQLSNMGAAALAARSRALSADHLEFLDEDGVRAMAQAGTIAVLLPGAFYFLRETRVPPVDLLRRHGVPIAIATDMNPGTSPFSSLLLMLNMACTLFRLTPHEALTGVTSAAAAALGLGGTLGTLAVGRRADLALWPVAELAELCYSYGTHRPAHVMHRGVLRSSAPR